MMHKIGVMGHIILIVLMAINVMGNAFDTEIESKASDLITFTTEDGGTIEASLFEGGKDMAVVFAHGAIFNKESWYFLCERLQSKEVTSLSIDFRGYGNSKKGSTNNMALDVLGAIAYLKEQGYKQIALVGGSMGGAATLNALELKTDDLLKKVVLLSPAGSNGIKNNTIKKLFIVSKDEGLFARVQTSFDNSLPPKDLKIYEGTYHAQHMFKSDYAEELTQLIIDFLIK